MSNDWYYVHQLAVLAGFRLIVLANRIGCSDDFSRALHDRLADGLACAAARVRSIMTLQGELASEPDLEGITAFQLEGEKDCFNRFRIALLDDLEIDFATHEYRINNGEWHYALSADCDGIEISYPSTIALTDAELRGLGPIIRDISHETGIWVSAARIVYD
ncbi:hypothetical protein HGP14_29840 [Rhizobium sp. P32RR-XVIII]|uniref:hypothetical protein n=1 Tax=Rhizobium sp. P32RR-XVIII TaxID=2726738 RepID=UPI0014574686|nr:hypothetical protein [Rhizobium sp. P32RR-XVIII]NLS07480.1 hypothetical protein [Rhizobium sp. P32RR-XVIII]